MANKRATTDGELGNKIPPHAQHTHTTKDVRQKDRHKMVVPAAVPTEIHDQIPRLLFLQILDRVLHTAHERVRVTPCKRPDL